MTAPAERRCRLCAATTGLRRLVQSPLSLDAPAWVCSDGCPKPGRTPHPLAGKTVWLNGRADDPVRQIVMPCAEYKVDDWWINVAGMSWTVADGNPAAMQYGLRAGMTGLPSDDEVVYGHIGGHGHLVHVSELGGVQE